MSSSALEKSLLNLNREKSLKDLFWTQLNYDRVNKKLSRKKLERLQWHFLNVKYDDSPQKRKLFRRIKVEAGDNQLRTATEQLSLLDLELFNSDSPLAIQKQHDEAFDVEVVTEKFFYMCQAARVESRHWQLSLY